jgi:hypothetical protein
MILKVEHSTLFEYDIPIYETATEVRLHPDNNSAAPQRCTSFDLQVEPPATIFEYTDFYGNQVNHFNLLRERVSGAGPTLAPSSSRPRDWVTLPFGFLRRRKSHEPATIAPAQAIAGLTASQRLTASGSVRARCDLSTAGDSTGCPRLLQQLPP